MLFSNKKPDIIAFFLVWTIASSSARIQKSATTFLAGKGVVTSHTVLQPYSELQCVRRCVTENQRNMCNVAEYHPDTHVCKLSVDSHQELINFADDNVGVFIIPKPTLGTSNIFVCVFNIRSNLHF